MENSKKDKSTDDIVLLDLDAFAEKLDTITAKKTLGFDLKIGDMSKETWIKTEELRMGLNRLKKEEKDSMEIIYPILLEQAYCVLKPFNSQLSKLDLEKIPFTSLIRLIRISSERSKNFS